MMLKTSFFGLPCKIFVSMDTTVEEIICEFEEQFSIAAGRLTMSRYGRFFGDEKTMTELRLEDGAEVTFTMGMPGGGKRARTGATGAMNKQTRLDETFETIGMSGLRLQASPFRHPVMDQVVHRITGFVQAIQDKQEVIPGILAGLSDEDIVEAQAAILLSNPERRASKLAKLFFRRELDNFAEVKKLMGHLEGMMDEIVVACLTGDYSEADGCISWEKFGKQLLTVENNRGRQVNAQPANGMQNGLGR